MKTVINYLLLVTFVTGCSGGGGGSTVSEYKMTDVKPLTGFVYATQQNVAIDIALPYPGGVVTIYETRPLSAIYDTAGNSLATPVVSEPAFLLQGLSSSMAEGDGLYHYRETLVMPVATKTVYLATPARIDVPVTNGTVTYTFNMGGA